MEQYGCEMEKFNLTSAAKPCRNDARHRDVNLFLPGLAGWRRKQTSVYWIAHILEQI